MIYVILELHIVVFSSNNLMDVLPDLSMLLLALEEKSTCLRGIKIPTDLHSFK